MPSLKIGRDASTGFCVALVLVAGMATQAAAQPRGRPTVDQGSLTNGAQAPDFTLSSPDGATTVTLSTLRGKPVVLVFGSCTCPPFVRSTSLVAPLHERYRGRVHFLMVYIREAHPLGEREIRGNPFQIEAPTTYAERCDIATKFDERIGIAMPIVVDSIDDRVAGLYAPWPNRLVVIDADGMIADKGVAAPDSTRDSANRLTDILDRLLAKN